jgi:hypothetical protein
MQPFFAPAALTAFIVGCASGAPTVAPSPSPSPSPSPVPSPSASAGLTLSGPTQWTFGAVEAVRTATERQIVFQKGEDYTRKNYGLGGSTYVKVGGQEYMLSFETLANLKDIKVGDTVNLHPSTWYAGLQSEGGTPTYRRLFNIYKGSQGQPPLILF